MKIDLSEEDFNKVKEFWIFDCKYQIDNNFLSGIESEEDIANKQFYNVLQKNGIGFGIDNLLEMAKSRPNVTVLYAWVHAKVCLLLTHEHHYVIEGSGNWSENAHYEQYVFANSKGLYDFRMKLFTDSKLKKY